MSVKTKTRKITALQVLTEMDKINRERKSPSIPPAYIVGTKHTDKTANGLTKAIIQFINLSGGQAERINSMGRMVDKTKIVNDVLGRQRTVGSIEWQKGTGTKGTADISCVAPGGFSIKIEVKIGNDKQSEDQKKYEATVNSVGGLYIIAKEFAPFVKFWVSKYGKSEILNSAINRLTNA